MRNGPIGDSQRMPPPVETRICVDIKWIGRREGVAGIEEDDALQAERLDDREDDLVVEDELLAAADRVAADDLGPAS